MATLYSVAKSGNLGFRGFKPGAWPRELLLLRHAGHIYIQGKSYTLFRLGTLIMMLKIKIIIIIAKGIGSACSSSCCCS
jgi:hypothetical protein